MVVLSDFLTVEPALAWKAVARRHDVVAVRLIDPREDALPPSGLVDLVDSELGTTRTVDFGSRKVREAYAREAETRSPEFRRWCDSERRVGAGRLDGGRTDLTPDPVLRRSSQASRWPLMAPEQEAGGTETLVPPRPNLGPEPWPDTPGWLGRPGGGDRASP